MGYHLDGCQLIQGILVCWSPLSFVLQTHHHTTTHGEAKIEYCVMGNHLGGRQLTKKVLIHSSFGCGLQHNSRSTTDVREHTKRKNKTYKLTLEAWRPPREVARASRRIKQHHCGFTNTGLELGMPNQNTQMQSTLKLQKRHL